MIRLLGPLLLLPAGAGAQALALPPGASPAFEAVEAPAGHALATGPWTEAGLPLRMLEGRVTRQSWETPQAATTLALLAPLRDGLLAEGWAVLLDCEAEACGGFDFRDGVEILPPPAMFVDLADFRYLSAVRDGEGLSLLVSRSGERGFVQAIHVAEGARAPPEAALPEAGGAPLAPAAPEGSRGGSIGARLDAEGHAVIEGLRFAPGSADLGGGGEEALAALAAWLAADPSRRVAIVGHTDATGALEANIALSRERARAVAARLVREHGADAARIEAQGMGWLAPVASNLTPEGREANRRVEAVALP